MTLILTLILFTIVILFFFKINALFKQNLVLKEANKAKNRFLTIISHDLINPFNSILGYINILEEDFDSISNEDKKQFISIVNRQSKLNYKLVKNLLYWARVQQNKIELNKAHHGLKTIVKYVTDIYMLMADQKKIKTIIDIDEDSVIYADKDCLCIIISNIYSNAIKFSTTNGFIEISSKDNLTYTTIIIKDNGVGMSLEQQKNILQYDQVSSTKGTKDEIGNGIGLNICKELTDLHKGKLTIDSSITRGTSVAISLPKAN